jgi:hypothetical protein
MMLVRQMHKPNPLIMPLLWHGWLKVLVSALFYAANIAVCVSFAIGQTWWTAVLYVAVWFVLLSYIELTYMVTVTPYEPPAAGDSWQGAVFGMLRPALVCGLALPYLTYYYLAYKDEWH